METKDSHNPTQLNATQATSFEILVLMLISKENSQDMTKVAGFAKRSISGITHILKMDPH